MEYLEAIQTPQVCFTDQRLKAARIYKDNRGIPLAATGRSAVVFRADVEDADVALRCFTREARQQQSRYQALHTHLAEDIPSYMVGFNYEDREILVSGQLYPVVEMGWAEGQPLHLWVDQHLQYPQHLVRLAATWLGTVKDLQDRSMAHGDLSSDNCLVAGRNLTLIDYDSFFIPALARSNPGEAGNPHFQHPRRMGYYALDMDAFSALVIYLSLLALAADHSLWRFHNGKNLIFTAEDYASPGGTPLWRALARIPDKRIAPLSTALADMCKAPIAGLPPLSQVAVGSSIPRRSWRAPPTIRSLWPLTWPASLTRLRPRRAVLLAAGAAAALVFLVIWLTSGASPGPRSVSSVAFSPDAKTLAAAAADGATHLWDVPARNVVATLPDPSKQAVNAVAFSPDGKTLATGDAHGGIYLWAIPAGNLVRALSAPAGEAINSLAFSPDGKTLAIAAADGTYLLDLATKNQVATLPDPSKHAVNAVAFSPDGKTLATGDADGGIDLWDLATKNQAATLPDPSKQAVKSVAFSPDGKTLAAADADGATRLWDIPASNLVATLSAPAGGAVNSVAFNPDGTTLATADADGDTYLWDLATKNQAATLPDPNKQAVLSVAFLPDGVSLATVNANGATYEWGIPAKLRSSS